MAMEDAFHDGQARAHAFEVAVAVQALEDAKQLVHVCHVETDAIVADRVLQASRPARRSQFR